MFASVFHRQRGQFIGQPHALDFLRGLDGASFVQERRSVNHPAGNFAESVEVHQRRGRGLAHHAVGRLRTHVQFDGNFVGEAAFLQHLQHEIESAILRRARISFVIALEKPNVLRPGIALGVRLAAAPGQ